MSPHVPTLTKFLVCVKFPNMRLSERGEGEEAQAQGRRPHAPFILFIMPSPFGPWTMTKMTSSSCEAERSEGGASAVAAGPLTATTVRAPLAGLAESATAATSSSGAARVSVEERGAERERREGAATACLPLPGCAPVEGVEAQTQCTRLRAGSLPVQHCCAAAWLSAIPSAERVVRFARDARRYLASISRRVATKRFPGQLILRQAQSSDSTRCNLVSAPPPSHDPPRVLRVASLPPAGQPLVLFGFV